MSRDQAQWIIGLLAVIVFMLLPWAVIAWYNIGDHIAAERIRRKADD